MKYFILVESLGVIESFIFIFFKMIYVFILSDWCKELGIIDGLICIFVGFEDVEDLIEDLEEVLK